MRIVKIKLEDNVLIKAYAKWCIRKGYFPKEYECSRLIENMNGDHRDLVDNFLADLRLKQYNDDYLAASKSQRGAIKNDPN